MKQPPGPDHAGARVKRALCHDNPLAASLALHQADSTEIGLRFSTTGGLPGFGSATCRMYLII